MQASDIAHARLAAQQISASAFEDPEALMAHMGAMQAQDHASALWAIGLRVKGATISSVRAAIAGRALVRTWLLRGTLHYAAAADLRWLLALVGARNSAGAATRQRQLGLDARTIGSSRTLLERALAGTTLTRGAVFELLNAHGIDTAGQRGIHILWQLAQEGVLCFSAHEGKQPAFALLDDWVAAAPELARDEALARLAARYIGSHGPASAADLAYWSGLTLGDARKGLAAADGLEQQGELWIARAASTRRAARNALHLLPGFDEYLLGYKDRTAVLDPAHATLVVPGGNGMFKPMIVVGGRVVGTWQRAAADLAPQAFSALGAAQQSAFARATARYHAFWEGQP